MYDELVKALRGPYNSMTDTQIKKQAADAIEELSATISKMEKATHWIPVTERKPKTDDIVIVAIHDDSGDTPYDVTNVGFYLDVFPLGIWVVENERCNYVTHWMQLPPAPKEKPTCEDCQRECQMMGLDMEACASYEPPKEEE